MYKFHSLIYAFLLNLNKSCYQHEYATGNVSCDRPRSGRLLNASNTPNRHNVSAATDSVANGACE